MSKPTYQYWINAGFYNGMQRLTVMLFGMASFIVLSRVLTQSHRGVWDLFLVFTANIETVRAALVKNAFIKYWNGAQEKEHSEIASAALALNIIVTGAIILLLGALTIPLSSLLNAPELKDVLYIFIIGLLLLIPFSHFEWLMAANTNFRGVFWAYLVRQGSWFGMMIIHLFVYKTISLNILAAYYTLGIGLGCIVSYFFARIHMSGVVAITKHWIKQLFSFGKIILGSSFGTILFKTVDQSTISSFISTTALSIYSTSLRIINLLDLPSYVLGDIMFPKSARTIAEGDHQKIKYMYEKSVGAILSVLVPIIIFIFIFPQFIILLLAGSKYLDTVGVLRLMLVNSIFSAFIMQFATIMDSTGHAKINFRVITFMALLCTGLCVIWVPAAGILGAVYSVICTQLAGFCISQYLLHKYYGIRFWNAFKYAFTFYPELLQIVKQRFGKWKLLS